MRIDHYETTYFYPPRPILFTINSGIERYSNDPDWIAEVKMNGTNCEVKKVGSKWQFWDRHHKLLQYNTKVSREVIKELDSLNAPDGTIFNVELLNDKTRYTKHVLFFHTILAWNFELYSDIEYGEQRKQLEKLFDSKKFEHLWLAEHYRGDFNKIFQELISKPYGKDPDLVEGIVLKNLKRKLQISPHNSKDFGLKIRKPSKNYTH